MAVKREIREVEAQLDAAEAEFQSVYKKLGRVAQERLNVEEELTSTNVRLKQMLGELKAHHQCAAVQSSAPQRDSSLTLEQLTRKVETSLMRVLEERFNDEAFTSAISEQSVLSTADKVHVTYEGDEAYWALQDNYTFEMLLHDASRYWDILPQNAVLHDERGAM